VIRKELRSLLPVALLVVAFLGTDLFYLPLTSRLDDQPWTHQFNEDLQPGRGETHAIGLAILGLMAAYSLFPREHDEGTIHFLHSLPVSRSRIFAAKTGAALLVLWFGLAVEHAVAWWLQSFNTQSFSGGQFDARTAAGAAFLHAAFAALVVAHGMLLSFFRKFGFVLLGVVLWAYVGVKEIAPSIAILDPAALLALEYEGRRLVLPWGGLLFHASLALGSLGLAWFLWTGAAERFSALYSRAAALPWGKVFLAGGTVALIGLGLSLIVYTRATSEPEPAPVRYVSFELADAATAHYRFRYPVNLRRRALRLIERAEEVHGALRDLLGAADGDPVVVDLSEVSADHAGIARWQKVRMGLVEEDGDDDLLRTFAHEAGHTFQYRESNRRVADNALAAAFFVEGSAEWLAFRVVPRVDRHAAARRLAVATWRRQKIDFETLADRERLGARHDGNLVYPLGETWTAALAAAHGDAAVGRVLRAIGREGAPRGLEPVPFWQDSLQAAGCDLERVLGEWKRLLEGLEQEHRGFLDALPSLGGGITGVEGEEIVFTAVLDRPTVHADDAVLLRVRERAATADEDVTDYAGAPVAGKERTYEFRVPRGDVRGRRCEFSFGVETGPGGMPYYEEWQEGKVPR